MKNFKKCRAGKATLSGFAKIKKKTKKSIVYVLYEKN